MTKMPRKNVLENQIEIVKDTFENVDAAFLEQLRGGQAQMRYGLPPVRCRCKRGSCQCKKKP